MTASHQVTRNQRSRLSRSTQIGITPDRHSPLLSLPTGSLIPVSVSQEPHPRNRSALTGLISVSGICRCRRLFSTRHSSLSSHLQRGNHRHRSTLIVLTSGVGSVRLTRTSSAASSPASFRHQRRHLQGRSLFRSRNANDSWNGYSRKSDEASMTQPHQTQPLSSRMTAAAGSVRLAIRWLSAVPSQRSSLPRQFCHHGRSPFSPMNGCSAEHSSRLFSWGRSSTSLPRRSSPAPSKTTRQDKQEAHPTSLSSPAVRRGKPGAHPLRVRSARILGASR